MNISDWKIYSVKAAGATWAVEVRYATAPNRTETIELFANAFGQHQTPYAVINGVKVVYSNFVVENAAGTIVTLYLRKKSKDYYAFPPFLSWGWNLENSGWFTLAVDDSFTVTGTGPESSVDPFELGSNPFIWEVSAVAAAVGNTRTITVEETSGASENMVLAYIQNFFLKNAVIYINSKQYICYSSGVKVGASESTLVIREEDYSPVVGEAVEVATLNSSMNTVLGENSFDVLLKSNSIDSSSLKIFYDFNHFDGDYVQSTRPAPSGTYSGQVFGSMAEFANATHTGEGFFNNNNYIKIENAEEIFSNDFTFLFSCSKTDNSNATIFSSLGGYTNPTSGFALGISNSNRLYFQNYEYLQPNILTLNTKNSDKNIFCILDVT